MADTNTKIIIDVSLNSQDATAKANELGDSIVRVKREQKEMKEQGKENDAAYVSNAIQLRALTQEQKAYVRIAHEADGSNNQLSAQLSLLTQQYNAMSREERLTTVAGQALQVQIKGVSDELKESREAVGDHRMSVGDYEKANRSATESLEEQKDTLQGMTSVMNQAPIGFKLLGDQVGTVKNQIKNYKEAVQASKIAQEELSAAQRIATEATAASEQATEKATSIGFKFASAQEKAEEATKQAQEALQESIKVGEDYVSGTVSAAEAERARVAALDAQSLAQEAAAEAQRLEAAATEAQRIATDSATVATARQTAATEAQIVATNTATNASKVFKVALASTGIGVIIVLVGSLLAYLSKFDPVMDKVEQALSAVSAMFKTLGKVVVDFFSSITSVMDLLGKIGDVIAHPIDSFNKLGTAMKTAANAAIELKKAQQDLEDEQKIQEIRNARALQQINQLTIQARNRTLSEKERQRLLKEASAIDQKNFEERDEIAKKELKIAQDQIAITAQLTAAEKKELDKRGLEYAFALKDRAAVTDEEVDALKDAELKRIEILNDATSREEKRQNLADQVAEKAAAAEEKRQAQIQQAREKAADAENARLDSLIKTNEAILTERQREVAAVNREIDEKVAKYKKYGATTEQLERERTARLLQISDEYRKKDLAAIDANIKTIQDISVAMIKDEGERRLAQQKLDQVREVEQLDAQQLEVRTRVEKGEKGLEDLIKSFDDKRSAILAEGSAIRQQLIRENYAMEVNAFNEQQVALAEAAVLNAGTDADKLEAQQALLDAQYQMEIDHANAVGEDTTLIVAQFAAEQRKLNEDKDKAAMNSFNAFSNSFQTLTGKNSLAGKIAADISIRANALQTLSENKLFQAKALTGIAEQIKKPFPLNLVAVFSTLAALGSAIVSAKQLTSVPAFADGVIDFQSDGKGSMVVGRGTGTSDSINARLSNGESVINAKSTKMFKPLLNIINKAGGGADLAPGYAMATGGIAQGGFVSNMTNEAMNIGDVANLVIEAVRATPAPIVDVKEILTAQDRMAANKVRVDI